ncbi:hypothetical protein ACFZAU_14115 [Streptomyces sp. NPDC008238]
MRVLLLTSVERDCQGRVGPLLDQDQLQGLETARPRVVRITVWAVLTAGGVVAVSLEGMSESAEQIGTGLVVVVVAAALFQRNIWRVWTSSASSQAGRDR